MTADRGLHSGLVAGTLPPDLRRSSRIPAGGAWEARLQFLSFCAVGAAGAVVNLVVYTSQVTLAQVAPLVAATVAFCVAMTHNYLANRWVTFRRHRAGFASQGARFAAVSTLALGVNLVLLALLLGVLDRVGAQALAICLTMPVNFLGNKLWSFGGGVS